MLIVEDPKCLQRMNTKRFVVGSSNLLSVRVCLAMTNLLLDMNTTQ